MVKLRRSTAFVAEANDQRGGEKGPAERGRLVPKSVGGK
jgi:hypothetical protein